MRAIDIPSSTPVIPPWRVEERSDSRHGGIYIYCPCPAWKFQGQRCKHALAAMSQWSNPCRAHSTYQTWCPSCRAIGGWTTGTPTANVTLTANGKPVTYLPEGNYASGRKAVADKLRDPHAAGLCEFTKPHTAADHEAAVLLTVI